MRRIFIVRFSPEDGRGSPRIVGVFESLEAARASVPPLKGTSSRDYYLEEWADRVGAGAYVPLTTRWLGAEGERE